MKNQIQQFHNKEFGSLEILMINGKPYFPATECAAKLGYANPRKAIIDHCKGVTKRDSLSAGGVQERNFIPEGDLYRLIARSKLPSAERFEKWIFDELLPCIRKHGFYATDDTLDAMMCSPEFAEVMIKRLAEERRKNAALEGLAEELVPKALYCDIILQCKNTVPVSLIAKDYGMSAMAFNRLLHGLGVQYPIAGTWLLYQKHSGMGYTQTRTYLLGERASAIHTRWTQKGRLFLYELLKYYSILPTAEKPGGALMGGDDCVC